MLAAGWTAALAFALAACAGSGGGGREQASQARALNLDSLNQHLDHEDSVSSNAFFYEDAWKEYHKRYPGVDQREYTRIAQGKDQEFCLFKPEPASTCLDNGDKFNDLGLKPPARDAYEAGLLSEAYNDSTLNVKLWGSMGQLCAEEKDNDNARYYFTRILNADPKNKWAKKQLSGLK